MMTREFRRAMWHRIHDLALLFGFAFISGVIMLTGLVVFLGVPGG